MSISPLGVSMVQPRLNLPLGAIEANGAAQTQPAAATAPVTPTPAAAAAPVDDKNTVTIKSSKDTIWAAVKAKLGAGATDKEIFDATAKVLKANDLTWDSAKSLKTGDTFKLDVLDAGKPPAAPAAAADTPGGQPLGAAEAAAADPATPAAPAEAAAPKNEVTLKSGDTIWAHVKKELGPDATDKEIFDATEKVLKANGQTWDSAKTMKAGEKVDLGVLNEGKTPAVPAAPAAPAQPAAPATGLPLGAQEAGLGPNGVPTGPLPAIGQGGFLNGTSLETLLLNTFGSLDPSVQAFLPQFGAVG